jgi:hypothetical protein
VAAYSRKLLGDWVGRVVFRVVFVLRFEICNGWADFGDFIIVLRHLERRFG